MSVGNNLLRCCVVAFLIVVGQGVSQAEVMLVDTGAASSSGNRIEVSKGTYLAGQFNINTPFTINAVDAWMGLINSGTMIVALRSDQGGLPGSLLFSQEFAMTCSSTAYGWKGFSGLNWENSAGTYWIALEPPSDSPLVAAGMPAGAPNPLSKYAVKGGGAYGNMPADYQSLGFQIVGAVPEPSTWSLLVLSSIGFASHVIRRRKNDG